MYTCKCKCVCRRGDLIRFAFPQITLPAVRRMDYRGVNMKEYTC